jgi:hypothetical protein
MSLVIIFLRFFFFFFVYYSNCINVRKTKGDTEKLLGIIQIINHGASTPVNYYDKANEIFSPQPSGILTPKGVKQMKVLGSYIKSKYFTMTRGNSLIDNIENSNYLALSLGLPRCINSAISHIQSIFSQDVVGFENGHFTNKENNLEISKPNLDHYFDFKNFINITAANNIKDVMINFMNFKYDKLLSPRKCFKFDNTGLNYIDDDTSKSDRDIIVNSLNSTFPYLITDLIENNFDLEIVSRIYDFLNSISHHNSQLFKPDLNLTKILAKYKILNQYKYLDNDEDLKMLTSNLFDLFIDKFDHIVNYERGNLRRNSDEVNYNTLFIFGDERNFIDVFNNLIDRDYLNSLISSDLIDENFHNELLPPFASHLVFELIKIEDNFYVKIIYNGEEIFSSPNKLKKLKNRSIPYSLEKGMKYEDFKELILSRINGKYKTTECN